MEYFHSPTDINSHNPFVSIAFHQAPSPEPTTNICALESHFICEILAAEWYNASGQSIPRCSIDEADKICKQVIRNLQAESSSTEAFLINLSALAGGPLMERLVMVRMMEAGGRKEYEGRWRMKFGGLEGSFTIRVCVDERAEEMTGNAEAMEESWKKQYLDLQLRIRDRDEKVGSLKRGLLDALVESNQYSRI
ncbi:hypothetical protein B7494_g3037 [Chlorociboria aeruginascens]|nr:hypothetical protein B7494_g3037 [Chlorociboria aeruginascens]